MEFFMTYLWEDLDARNVTKGRCELKFGDHFVKSAKDLTDAKTQTEAYVRSSLGRQKHKFEKGRVTIYLNCDASKYARQHNRFAAHKKIDDVLRKALPGHVTADIHEIDIDEIDNFIVAINQELIKHKQPKPAAGLSRNQYNAATDVLNAISEGAKVILADLCARFGKTIWSGVIIKESDVPLTIVTSYVLTSFASFLKEFTSFSQFLGFVLVDTKADDYQAKVKEGLKAGKQVVAFVSLCVGEYRKDRIKFLFGLKTERLLIVDEADFGAHKKGQSAPLIKACQEDDVVILMTGTNGDRAVSDWKVDHYVGVTYPELLMERTATEEAQAA